MDNEDDLISVPNCSAPDYTDSQPLTIGDIRRNCTPQRAVADAGVTKRGINWEHPYLIASGASENARLKNSRNEPNLAGSIRPWIDGPALDLKSDISPNKPTFLIPLKNEKTNPPEPNQQSA